STTFTGLSAGTYTFTVTNSVGCTSAESASATINQQPSTLANGLVAYYPFNGNANDTSVNANNGLVTRATLATDRFGKENAAYEFNGANSSIKIPFTSSINSIQKGLSVSAWIYMQGGTGASNPPRLLELRGAYGNGGNAGFVLLSQGNSDSARTFETRWYSDNGNTNISIAPTSSVKSKEWHHIVFTADGESGIGKFYVDGLLKGTNAQMTNQGKITSCDYNNNAIFIGIEPGGTGAWGGKIDEVRLYNRPLDSSEISVLYNLNNTIAPSNLKIGDSYGGGIIAYILQPGDSGYSATVTNGIIVPSTDQGRLTYPWGCSGTLIGETSNKLGTGASNTRKILAKCTASNIAAKLCDDLILNGYSDWFMPSLGDMQKIRNLHLLGLGNFSVDLSYFSSSEYDANSTYEFYISGGAVGQVSKNGGFCIRAARTF
ncbi:MAG: LamG domain-containing protein, partial [Bacteroidota bacterium]